MSSSHLVRGIETCMAGQAMAGPLFALIFTIYPCLVCVLVPRLNSNSSCHDWSWLCKTEVLNLQLNIPGGCIAVVAT